MRSIINKFREWQAKSDEKLLAKWPKERELGMTSYIIKEAVIHTALVCSVLFVVKASSIKVPDFSEIFSLLIIMFLVGLLTGYGKWSRAESMYQTKNGKFSSTMKTS